MTAKLTAILLNIGYRWRTSADPRCWHVILRGHRWTPADDRNAVFKTSWSRCLHASFICVGCGRDCSARPSGYSNAGGKPWHVEALSGTR